MSANEITACPAGCSRIRQPGKLLCLTCWREVPEHLQQEVNRAWRAWQRASRSRDLNATARTIPTYCAARDAALASVS